MTNTEFLINDFKEHPVQSSWDFEADLRFAKEIGDDEAVNLLRSMLKSRFVPAILGVFYHTIRPRITRKRLRVIRKLVEQGLVVTYWSGTGYGGKADFGVSRTRTYIWREWQNESKR